MKRFLYLSPATEASTPARGASLPEAPQSVCQTLPQVASANSCVEQELDNTIRQIGERMVQADKDGDPGGARIYADRMYAAIRSRTPEHQARLTAEAERRIDEGLCFFMVEGDRARLARRAE